MSKGDLSGLTKTECEVLALVAGGKNHKQIAALLNRSVGTIKIHTGHIREKLGLRNSLELVLYWHGLLPAQKQEAERLLADDEKQIDCFVDRIVSAGRSIEHYMNPQRHLSEEDFLFFDSARQSVHKCKQELKKLLLRSDAT